MKGHHWMALILVVGVTLDLVDEFTTAAGSAGGVVYGPTGFLYTVDQQLPLGLHVGTLLAGVGAAGMLYYHTLQLG